jgi:hypothetical protein
MPRQYEAMILGWTPIERRMRLLQTIHRDVAAVDPVGARRRYERNHIRNLLGGAESAHRKTVRYVVIEIIRIGEAVAVPAVALNQYRTRGHRIDANAVRHELQRPAVPTVMPSVLLSSRSTQEDHCRL